MQWWTCRNDKARRELGFEPRPHEETLTDAVRWQREQLEGRVGGRASLPERFAGGVVSTVGRVGGKLLGR
jgi:4-alpha-glucanotransferase